MDWKAGETRISGEKEEYFVSYNYYFFGWSRISPFFKTKEFAEEWQKDFKKIWKVGISTDPEEIAQAIKMKRMGKVLGQTI